ncbi:ABC transporter substrate-binding protein [[Clostridium] dakarense]|uniref:ABC transporter substrate-binding protein n=1 Tax=Faecalimicrobium dakarense TaxID=1301100 RepID=UPI0004BA9BC3|nr:ABC transporter substrate-binding protein [[Clostridium] dakarense]
MKKRKILAIILASALTVVGCGAKTENKTDTDTKKSAINSEYINLTMVKPETINPIINKDKSVGYIMNLIYDGLFTIDENYNVVPQLVEEYGISQDGMSIDIKLKDAKWHNGNSVTSQDVKYSIELIQKSPESPYKILTDNISSVSTINNKELTIKFKNKYAFSIDTLIFPIVSKDELSKGKADEEKNNLIGNGPYKIEKYGTRDGMILSVNKDYYGKLPSNSKDIKIGIVPDAEAQVSMVMALDSDITSVSLSDLSKFYEKEFNITKYEGRDYESVIFNYDNKFLKDVNFRKAISHAINKEKILEEGYMGNAKLVNFPLNSKSKYYNDDIKQLEYDKEKAKSYLAKVNLISDDKLSNKNEDSKDKNASKENKNNKTTDNDKDKKEDNKAEIKKMISQLNLKIVVNKNNSERVKSAYLISENLKAIGIKSTVVELVDKELDEAISSKKYDLALVGWELSSIPDARNIIENIGYSDEKLTGYITSLINATSQSQISDIYKSLQKYVNDNVLFMSLVIRDDYIVTNRRLEGKISPNDFDVYEGITNLNTENKK